MEAAEEDKPPGFHAPNAIDPPPGSLKRRFRRDSENSSFKIPSLESLALKRYLLYLEKECVVYLSLIQSDSRLTKNISAKILHLLKRQLNCVMKGGIASAVLREKMIYRVCSVEFPSSQFCHRAEVTSEPEEAEPEEEECRNHCCTGRFLQETMVGVVLNADVKNIILTQERVTNRRHKYKKNIFSGNFNSEPSEFNVPVVLSHLLAATHGRHSQLERIVLSDNFIPESTPVEEPKNYLTRLNDKRNERFVKHFGRAASNCPFEETSVVEVIPDWQQNNHRDQRKGLVIDLLVLFRDVITSDFGYYKLTELSLKNNIQCELYSKANFQFELLARIGLSCPRLRILDIFGTDTWADCLVALFFRDAFRSLHRYLFFMENEEDETSAYHPHDTTRYCQFCLDDLPHPSTTNPNPPGVMGTIERPFTINPIIPLIDPIYNHVMKKYPKRSYCILRNCVRVSDLVRCPLSSVFELERKTQGQAINQEEGDIKSRLRSSSSGKTNLVKPASPDLKVGMTTRSHRKRKLNNETTNTNLVTPPPPPPRKMSKSKRLTFNSPASDYNGDEDKHVINYSDWTESKRLKKPAPVSEPQNITYRQITDWPHLNECVQHLEVLNIGGTNVLGEFIPFVLLHAPRLKSLGQWINTMLYGLEILDCLAAFPAEKKIFRQLQEFSYSTDRNYFGQPYIGFVPESSDYKNVRKEMVRHSAKVAKKINHRILSSNRSNLRQQTACRNQIEEDMKLMVCSCPNVKKLNLVLHYKQDIFTSNVNPPQPGEPTDDNRMFKPWLPLLRWTSLIDLDLVTMKFANIAHLLGVIGDRLSNLTIEMDDEQGNGTEIVHIARNCPNLKNLRLLLGEKILRGVMTLQFSSNFFRKLERLTVEGTVHLHGFAFLWGHCRSLRYLKVGLVVSSGRLHTNVLIHDVFTLLFQVNKMEKLQELHIRNLKIRSLNMGNFLLDNLSGLRKASNWLLDVPPYEVKLFKNRVLKLKETNNLLLEFKEW